MNARKVELFVVMPVFNEQASLPATVDEWLDCFRDCCSSFTLCLINDGSTDGSLSVINGKAERNPEIMVVDQVNIGHGQSCLHGYRQGIDSGSDYVFQIDSDGQCDPRYFRQLWGLRHEHAAVFGYRRGREDGIVRSLISRTLNVLVWLGTGVRVTDANVPYRLVRRDTLSAAVDMVPEKALLANVLITIALQHRNLIGWTAIGFRRRRDGSSATSIPGLAAKAARLVPQLFRFRSELAGSAL